MNHRLAKIALRNDQDKPYTLTFYKTITDAHGRTLHTNNDAPIIVHAKKIILAMPRRSLELIESPFFDDPWLKENIKSVLIQKAFKMFMAYERPWWRSLGLVSGRSVTDLPIRQTYYMGTECEQEGGDNTMNSLLMASYNDIETIPFWKGLEKGEQFHGYKPHKSSCFVEGEEVVLKHEFQITQDMVEAAQRQIEALHDQKELPMPYSAVYQEWGEDPYGGGWHEWKANYRLDEVMCRMRHPVDKEDIYIVGEAYSYEQGWVEGALNTAESTLESFFGLEKPQWLVTDPDYQSWLDANHGFNFLPVPCPDGCSCDPGKPPFTCTNCGKTLTDVTEFAYEGINHVQK